jgi:hypothetical protein
VRIYGGTKASLSQFESELDSPSQYKIYNTDYRAGVYIFVSSFLSFKYQEVDFENQGYEVVS